MRILEGNVACTVKHSFYANCLGQQGEIIEMNVQNDHIHMIVMVPPKISISSFMGRIKGKSSIRVFNTLGYLRKEELGVMEIIPGDKVVVLQMKLMRCWNKFPKSSPHFSKIKDRQGKKVQFFNKCILKWDRDPNNVTTNDKTFI